ncbi:protein kinase family protein, partial [Candidatus Bathyarchaeota archaeon]|nr:protein kinase family protein [Candidatus Bathyarchaeota archaeon]
LLAEHGIDRALAQLLNHDNILSLAGVIAEKTTSSYGEAVSQVWLVWDYPDAGTLSQLFHDRRLAATYNGKRYMPESLCWHVLRSVLAALVYLHEGSRLIEEDDPAEGSMRTVDDDWHPVLHGAVKAENIFFQHPRGTEEYGVCRLGNFSEAFVSGKVADVQAATDTPAMGIVAGLKDGKTGSLDQIRTNLYTTVDPKTNVGPLPSLPGPM